MKKRYLIFALLIALAGPAFSQATTDTTFYVNPETAAKGFVKVPTRYRDQYGVKHLVVRDDDGNAFAIFKKGDWYYREPLSTIVTASAD